MILMFSMWSCVFIYWLLVCAQGSPDSNEFSIPPSDQYNLLNEPGPLGLKLKKSPSLLELIQATLSRCKRADNALRNGNLQVENKKKVKAKVAKPGPIDKLKASNFLAVLLRIGKWEVSQSYSLLNVWCKLDITRPAPPRVKITFISTLICILHCLIVIRQYLNK